ncbi:MAG: hypothetical protein AMXMBFR58_38510 [Phycisphaerae bacterium]
MADQADLIKQFEKRHKSLEQASGDSLLWQDGSDAAALLALRWHIEPLVFNGGWPSVYYNGSGWAVPLAARGYRLLGMPAAAERCELAARLVAKAEAEHPDQDRSSDEWLNTTLMDAVGDEAWDRLDDGWFEIAPSTTDALVAYLQAHPTT